MSHPTGMIRLSLFPIKSGVNVSLYNPSLTPKSRHVFMVNIVMNSHT